MGLVYSEPACQVAYDGDIHQLYHLLRKDPANLNLQEEHSGDTPLIAACRRGNLRVVRYLLENGADVHLINKKQRTCLHYVSRRSFSLLDYLMISILMPILLLGYFLMLQKQRQNVALMQAVLSSDVNIDAVDYMLCVGCCIGRCVGCCVFCVFVAEGERGPSLRLSEEESLSGSSAAGQKRRRRHQKQRRRDAAGHRHQTEVQEDRQPAEEDALTD